jgi:hypothetical protein
MCYHVLFHEFLLTPSHSDLPTSKRSKPSPDHRNDLTPRLLQRPARQVATNRLGQWRNIGAEMFKTWPFLDTYHLVMTNIAMVKPWRIEIDGLPFLKMVIFHGKLLNNQMVI